jgi:hypothetical protein
VYRPTILPQGEFGPQQQVFGAKSHNSAQINDTLTAA